LKFRITYFLIFCFLRKRQEIPQMAAAWAGAGGRQGVGHRGEEMSANEAATTGGVVGTERRKPGMRYSKIALRHVREPQR